MEGQRVKIRSKVACPECGRVFDLFNVAEEMEYRYGHDCEDQG